MPVECSPAELARAADCADLILAARQGGHVAVIVTLAVPFTPEGNLDGPEAVRRQRQAIADVQARLEAELASARPKVTTRFATTPLIALAVNEAGLRLLLASPRVLRIQRDVPRPAGG